MRFMILISAVVLTVSAATIDPALWEIDFPKFYKDDAIWKEALDCFLDKGPCREGDMTVMKEAIPETLAKDCADCSKDEKEKYMKIIDIVDTKYPNFMHSLREKFPGIKKRV